MRKHTTRERKEGKMQKYTKHFNTRKTPQSQPLSTAKTPQVKNRAGGFVWSVDDWTRLDRFLILGTEGGSYYVSEKKLTKSAATTVQRCIKADGVRTVARIVEISQAGRAHRNDAALFCLAMAAKLGNESTRAAAYKALPKVARIGTHLFHFMEYVKAFGGLGGNGFKRALQRWYMEKPAQKLAYQAVKYQQRDGWSHKDVLRLAKPPGAEGDYQTILAWITKGRQNGIVGVAEVPEAVRIIWAFEKAKVCKDLKEMIRLIVDHKLPHECVPNEWKGKVEVWDALLQTMPPHAMLRNLNKMTNVGLLTNMSDATKRVVDTLTDKDRLKKSRVHPMAMLVALKTYQSGKGFRGSMTWNPVRKVVDGLDKGFYAAFGAVEPTGKRLMLALDVSGSMGSPVSGCPMLTCREAAAAMALVTANVEDRYEIVGFTCTGRGAWQVGEQAYGWRQGVSPLDISPRQRLDDVVQYISRMDFGATDCALPMRYALSVVGLEIDAFCIYTDNESWSGSVHPDQALNEYRQKRGIPSKLVACAMTADKYSVANPDDAGQMDVIGFDTATPNVISGFVKGEEGAPS
jgi:60 kDa SS-A/Ro ribonucleoprotein